MSRYTEKHQGKLLRSRNEDSEFVSIIGYDENGLPICRRNATGQIGKAVENYIYGPYRGGLIVFPAVPTADTRGTEAVLRMRSQAPEGNEDLH